MSDVVIVVALVTLLVAVSVAALIGTAVAKASEELRSFVGFQGMHFEE